VWGDAADPAVLIQAHIARARVLVVATPDALNVRQMMETARTLNPAIETVIRSHNEDEARLLTQQTAATVFLGEHELAQAMARDVVRRAAAAA
jgi:CPA2 family monovalent cation:H+ antiporter-2